MENALDILKNTADVKAIVKLFGDNKPALGKTYEVVSAQYIVEKHDIFSENLRPNKTIKKDTGDVDGNNNPVLASMQVPVARIGIPLQKLIVERRVGFMLTEPISLEILAGTDSKEEQEFTDRITYIMNNNKMDYKNKEIARRMMSECEVAEVWYFVESTDLNDKAKLTLKMKILSPGLGDDLFPLFDTVGDMVAFGRGYKIKEDNKEIEHFDVYTADNEYKYIKRDEWALDADIKTNPVPNQVGKIMVVYYSQPVPEWEDVQTMISRLESNVSNHADTNDYFGSPILTVAGEIYGYAQKGETGKILQLEQGAQANYLALASEPQSIKMENENLVALIYAMSQTPNISFEEMRSLGNFSGIALRLMFLDAHMAVKAKEERFGIGLQRRINVIKAAIGMVIDTSKRKVSEMLQIKPVLTPYIPMNDTEIVENLTMSVGSGIMSKETAIESNPYVPDPVIELERVAEADTKDLAAKEEDIELKKVPPTK